MLNPLKVVFLLTDIQEMRSLKELVSLECFTLQMGESQKQLEWGDIECWDIEASWGSENKTSLAAAQQQTMHSVSDSQNRRDIANYLVEQISGSGVIYLSLSWDKSLNGSETKVRVL